MHIIFGIHAVISHIAKCKDNIINVHILQDTHNDRLNKIITLCNSHNIPIQKTTHGTLDKLSKNGNHQGVVIEINNPPTIKYSIEDIIEQSSEQDNAIIIILDGITDQHNLGAIIRTAECFNVNAIILPKDNSANVENSTTYRVSCGAIEHIPVITVSNINHTIDTLKKHGYWAVGTALSPHSQSLFTFNFDKKTIIVMGSEENGIRKLVRENCDYLVQIPTLGHTQSLNVSVAAGVVLSHMKYLEHTHHINTPKKD